MLAHLELERSVGGYEAASRCVADARVALAQLLGCDSAEIALAESAQRAWATAFSSLALRVGDRILCFTSEYAGNAVTFLQASQRTGCELHVLPMCANGIVDSARNPRAQHYQPLALPLPPLPHAFLLLAAWCCAWS